MGRTQEKQMGENVKGSNNNKIPQAPKVNLKKKNIKERKMARKNGDNYTGTPKDLD